MRMCWVPLLPIGCAWVSDGEVEVHRDADGDGHVAAAYGGDDCDDHDPDAWPGHEERYDGIDNDCSGRTDCDDDDDHDCDGEPSFQVGGPDCDDDAPSVGTFAPERCNGIDDDCDGLADEDGAVDSTPCFPDLDHDGYGPDADSVLRCTCHRDEVALGGECDDRDPGAHPGATEVWYDGRDADCDGHSDFDADFDGYDALSGPAGDDCDDGDPAISPGAVEVFYDGVDQDCDGHSDFDKDIDGHLATDWGGDDCDDADDEISPSIVEVYYDGTDANCDGHSDFDADSDGHDANPAGGDDCDDEDETVFLGAPELCDEVDNDCDALRDDADDDVALAPTWYADEDGDGFGGDDEVVACAPGKPYVRKKNDCDDGTASTWPDAPETCLDGVDSNCDGIDDCVLDEVETPLTLEAAAVIPMPAGDLNADGIDDLVVGSNDSDNPFDGFYVWLGNGGRTIDLLADATLVPFDPIDLRTTRAVGDVDGDGFPDLAWGKEASYAVRVLRGGPDFPDTFQVRSTLEEEDGNLGILLEGGDLDGDGTSDLFMTPLREKRRAYAVRGPVAKSSSVPEDATTLTIGSYVDAMHVASDVDGDGSREWVLTHEASGEETSSKVSLFVGDPWFSGDLDVLDADLTLLFEEPDPAPGNGVASPDLDGDGRADLVLGVRGSGTAEIVAYILPGPLSTDVSAARVVLGSSASTHPTQGDVDGDGAADLVLHSKGETDVGLLFYGPIDGDLDMDNADFRLSESDVLEDVEQFHNLLHFGAMGDLDGDGTVDLGAGENYTATLAGIIWGVPR